MHLMNIRASTTRSHLTTYDLAVIGGGPAGMMAAGRAAERGLKVILLEKNADLGKKLLISGGGRCNLTNSELDDRKLLAKFRGSDKFLFSAFAQHSVKESLEFFHARGLKTKVEEGGRVFPVTDKASSVWDVLLEQMRDASHGGNNPVIMKMDSEVVDFESTGTGADREIVAVRLLNGDVVKARSFIIATGGKSHPETGSTGDGFRWLTKLGHKISPAMAALVPITVSDEWVKAISGVSLPNAKITLYQNGLRVGGKQGVKKGKILFTHFGLSGPSILNMSSEVNELLKYGDVVMSLDLLPTHDHSTLNEALQKLFTSESNKKFKNAITSIIPTAFVPVVLEKSGITAETFCHSVTREERLSLIQIFKGLEIHPTGLLGVSDAIITSGGVVLEEIDFRTMRSRLVHNLYLVGDILNIDRPSGGYSLQLCWTTGWVAGNSVATSKADVDLS